MYGYRNTLILPATSLIFVMTIAMLLTVGQEASQNSTLYVKNHNTNKKRSQYFDCVFFTPFFYNINNRHFLH